MPDLRRADLLAPISSQTTIWRLRRSKPRGGRVVIELRTWRVGTRARVRGTGFVNGGGAHISVINVLSSHTGGRRVPVIVRVYARATRACAFGCVEAVHVAWMEFCVRVITAFPGAGQSSHIEFMLAMTATKSTRPRMCVVFLFFAWLGKGKRMSEMNKYREKRGKRYYPIRHDMQWHLNFAQKPPSVLSWYAEDSMYTGARLLCYRLQL